MGKVLYITQDVPLTDKSKYPEHRDLIIANIKEYYEATLDLCGEDDDNTADAKLLYERVSTLPVKEVEQDIYDYFQMAYDAVNGEVDYYYAGDEDFLSLFKKLRP